MLNLIFLEEVKVKFFVSNFYGEKNFPINKVLKKFFVILNEKYFI